MNLDSDTMTEIPGQPNYKISRCGQVWSRRRCGTAGGILKQQIIETGYATLCLGKCNERWFVHVLVAITFLPNFLNLPQVNHIDGNKLNNNVSNLEWISVSGNMKHAYTTGLNVARTGLESGNCKATAESLAFVKSSNLSSRKLAEMFHVDKATILYWKNHPTFQT